MSEPQQGTNFPAILKQSMGEIARALPKHMDADRMTRIALTCYRQTPQLAACEPRSILASVMMASQLGLEPGIGGQAYLIPYKRNKKNAMGAWDTTWECQFVPGWQGLVDLVSRAGRASVWTGAVFKGDEFDYALGDRPFVKHQPGASVDEKDLTHVYAVGRVKDADWPIIEVWTIEKVRAHLARWNKVGDRHYGHTHLEMYGRKVALMQVLKYTPKSVELRTAIELEAADATGRGQALDPFAVIEGEWSMPPAEDEPDQADNANRSAADLSAAMREDGKTTEPTVEKKPTPRAHGARRNVE